MESTKIYAHRGAMGEYPENTLLAFKKAMECEADGIELDVHMTKDGHIVIIHDDTVDRTTDGSGDVNNFTLSEIKSLSAGKKFKDYPKYRKEWDYEQVPTLEELFRLVSDYEHDLEINVELKTEDNIYEGMEEKLIELVNKYDLKDQVVFSSFHMPALKKLRQLDREVKIAALTVNPFKREAEFFEENALDAFHYPFNWLFKQEAITKMGLDQIRVWTVNEKQDISSLLNMKVKAIITNFPELAMRLKREIKDALPGEEDLQKDEK